MPKFAAYDDDAIWGIGDNPDPVEAERQAVAEASGFMRDTLPTDEVDAAIADLKTAPIADDLFDLVRDAEDDGSDPIPFKLEDGTLVIDDAKEAHADDAGEEAE